MKRIEYNNRRVLKGVGKLVVACLFLLKLSAAQAQQQALYVIANQKGAPASLTSQELKSVMMGEKQRWPDKNKVVIALIKTNNPLGAIISTSVFDMKPDELNKYWLALVFQGKASAPVFFHTVPELQNFVAQNLGAIGIVDQPINTPEIKTVAVNGRKNL